MKKLFLFLLSVLFSCFVYSQNERTFYNIWEEELFKKKSDEYFCLGPNSFQRINKGLDYLGSATSFMHNVQGVFIGQDSSVLVSATTGGNLIGLFIRKFDKNWNKVAQYHTYRLGKYGGELSNGIVVFGGQDKIMQEDNRLTFIDTLENEIWTEALDTAITDIYVTKGDTVVSITEKSLYLFSPSGDTIGLFPNYGFHHTVPISNNQWVGQRKDSLFLLSSTFELLSTTNFPDAEVLDMEAGYGKIVLLTEDSTFYIFDNSLAFQNNFKLDENNLISFKNFELTEDGIIVAGKTKYYENDFATYFKKYHWDGSSFNDENNDVGIVSVDLGNNFSIYPISGQWATPEIDTVYQLIYHEAVFTVKNYGETTIESLVINTFFPYLFVDIYDHTELFNGFIRKNANNISIEPSEEKKIHRSMTFTFVDPPNGEIYDQCFWVSLPNNRIDDDPTNDSHCFEMAVSTDEELLNNPTISIFPNPSNGIFKLSVNEIKSKNAEWILYDQYGRQQFLMPLNNWQNEYDILLPHLPTGIYFWKIQTKDRQIGGGKILIRHF